MDKVDLIILQELTKDARKPFRIIAKKVGISTQTIIKRYNRMKENGTIEQCSITVDLRKIGYSGKAGLFLTSKTEFDIREIINNLVGRKNIVGVTPTFGDYEGYALLVFTDLEDLYQQIIDIKKIPGLLKVEMSFSLTDLNQFPPSDNSIMDMKI